MAGNPDAAALELALTAVEADLATALEQGNLPSQSIVDVYGRAFEVRQLTQGLRGDAELSACGRLYQILIKAFTSRAEQIATEVAAIPLDAAFEAFAAAWNRYDRGIGAIEIIHRYLTMRYIEVDGLESIEVLGDRIFAEVVTQRLPELRFPDAWSHGFVVALLDSLSKKNAFTSREARLYDLVSQFVRRRAIQAGAKLQVLGPDAALDALPAVWEAYSADVERFVMQLDGLSKYIESEGIESVKALGKRFFIEETHFREPGVLDRWQHRMLTALLSGSLPTNADAKIGRILLQLCEPSAALYVSRVEIPLREAAANFYHEKAAKYLTDGGSEVFEEAVQDWLRMERERAEMCILEQNREGYVESIVALIQKFQRADA